MDLREVQPPPPSAISNMMMGVGPTHYPSSMPNSNSSMIAPNSAAAHIMSPTSRFPFISGASPVSKPLDSPNSNVYDGSSTGLRTGDFNIGTEKKKRGRPRKYSPDGNIALRFAPTPVDQNQGNSGGTPLTEPAVKKGRGRPPGSGKKQMNALGTGGGFTVHVILVNPGEDIASKITAFSEQGPRTVCVLSAYGAVCNVMLRQPASCGGNMSYEGKYELISLSGSYLFAENHSGRSQSGCLTVIMAGADGRVLGGEVSGVFLAATQVQVIVGSFIVDEKKGNANLLKSCSSTAPPQMINLGPNASPSSQMASCDSSDENASSPLTRPPGIYSNTSQPIQNNVQMYRLLEGWHYQSSWL